MCNTERGVERSTTSIVYERNPYYWKVDTAGNQLPYIDRIQVSIVDPEVYNLRVINGEVDYAYTATTFDNFTLYKDSEVSGDYRVISMPGALGSEVALGFNLNDRDATLRTLFQNVKFRRAMSVAIDREEINKVVFFRQGVPRQATVLPSLSYYEEEWGNAYAQYDPALANRLLDEAGLTERDRNGFRLGPDGEPWTNIIEYSSGKGAVQTTLELVAEFWSDVGVRTELQFQEANFFHDREATNEHHLRTAVVSFCDEIGNYTQGSRFFASAGDIIAITGVWASWYGANRQVEQPTAQPQQAHFNIPLTPLKKGAFSHRTEFT